MQNRESGLTTVIILGDLPFKEAGSCESNRFRTYGNPALPDLALAIYCQVPDQHKRVPGINNKRESLKKKRIGLVLPCRDDQRALACGHELADCTLCKLAADF
jgi:hypothetical protein